MKSILKIVISFILIGIIIWKMGGLQKFIELLAGMKISHLLLVLILYTADRVLMTYKWLRLLRAKSMNISLFQGLKVYCASMIWGMFMPATIGADAIRIVTITRKGYDAKEIIASVIIERLAGFLSALLLGIIGSILIMKLTDLGPQIEVVFWLGCATLLFGVSVFVMSFSQSFFDLVQNKILGRFKAKKIIQKIMQFHLSYKDYQNDKREIFVFFVLTFCEQLMPILITWFIARGLGIEVGLLFVAGAFPLALLVSRLPISINGLGVFAAVFALLMSFAGISTAQAVAIAFAGGILQTIAWLPWWASEVISSGSIKPTRLIMAER